MKKLVIALTVLASSSVFAAESAQSEFYHQSTAGQHEGTAALGFIADGENGSADLSGQLVGLKYDYGFNDMFAVGVAIAYSQLKVKQSGVSADATGLNDILVTLAGKQTLGEGLRYGADLSLGLQNGETKANGDQNVATGGIILAPYVGYEWARSGHLFGAKLQRDVRLKDNKSEDKTSSPSVTTETSGEESTTITGFYEHAIDATWSIGGSLAYAMNDDSKPDGGTDEDMGTTTAIEVYAPIQVGPGTLIPSIERATDSGADTNVKMTTVTVAYRMDF